MQRDEELFMQLDLSKLETDTARARVERYSSREWSEEERREERKERGIKTREERKKRGIERREERRGALVYRCRLCSLLSVSSRTQGVPLLSLGKSVKFVDQAMMQAVPEEARVIPAQWPGAEPSLAGAGTGV